MIEPERFTDESPDYRYEGRVHDRSGEHVYVGHQATAFVRIAAARS